MRRVTLLLAGVLLASCAKVAPPWPTPPALPIDLKASLSASEAPLLAPLELSLDLYLQKGQEVEFAPQVPAGFAGALGHAISAPLGEGTWRHQVLSLRPVRGPGELVVPPFTAKGKDGAVATTPELKLMVTSVMANAGPAVEAPGQPFPPSPRYLLALGAAALGALVLGLIAFFLRSKRRLSPAEVVVPPHVKALRALGRLRGESRRTVDEIEAFYVAVSQILRVYLEEAFALHAPERTTEEFLAELEAGHALSQAQRSELRAFLQQCDLVKFAAQVPGEDVHTETFAIAERFVEGTRPDAVGAAANANGNARGGAAA